MKKIIAIFCVMAIFGCAKIKLETAKPIKVDINMRVDVYQHVVKDVEAVEGQIYSNNIKQMNAIFTLQSVYAANYSSHIELAIQRRKMRLSTIERYLAKEYIGENRDAHLEIIGVNIPKEIKEEVKSLIEEENRDREIIYKAIAEKNGVSVSETRKVFFKDHYNRAPSGYWFEVYSKRKGGYIWIKK